ncbi:AbfB domain-containing protein [Streptomyces zingiberis]|uniref:Alpha-L-arabinofuranosidase B arabinose-binding domain-containing protein n=1 Tax=Streptomyces zingiberis TaxID=2053010 RepID=A0ABX1BYD4_9ACTN|nr:AbfB domain-containing protein [Streptomyces zingiberis]NJQ00324.1 hypothetical protein [Streptomyces zingiberis]
MADDTASGTPSPGGDGPDGPPAPRHLAETESGGPTAGAPGHPPGPHGGPVRRPPLYQRAERPPLPLGAPPGPMPSLRGGGERLPSGGYGPPPPADAPLPPPPAGRRRLPAPIVAACGAVVASAAVLALAFSGGGPGTGPADELPGQVAAPGSARPVPSLPGATPEESAGSPSAEPSPSPSDSGRAPSSSSPSADPASPSPSRTDPAPAPEGRGGGVEQAQGSRGGGGSGGREGAGGPGGTAEQALRSVNFPDRYVRHRNGGVFLDRVGGGDAAQAAFSVVPGLADRECRSFRTRDGRYLRHQSFRMRVGADDGSGLFRQDATFCLRPGAGAGSVTLQSYNFRDRHIRHSNFELRLEPYEHSAQFRNDASFRITGLPG